MFLEWRQATPFTIFLIIFFPNFQSTFPNSLKQSFSEYYASIGNIMYSSLGVSLFMLPSICSICFLFALKFIIFCFFSMISLLFCFQYALISPLDPLCIIKSVIWYSLYSDRSLCINSFFYFQYLSGDNLLIAFFQRICDFELSRALIMFFFRLPVTNRLIYLFLCLYSSSSFYIFVFFLINFNLSECYLYWRWLNVPDDFVKFLLIRNFAGVCLLVAFKEIINLIIYIHYIPYNINQYHTAFNITQHSSIPSNQHLLLITIILHISIIFLIINSIMGAKQTLTLGRDVFHPEEWVQVPLVTYTKNNDPHYSSNFTVLANKNRKYLQVEKYELFFNSPAEYRAYYESFEWRRSMPSIVTARYMKQITRQDLCATFYSSMICIQRIPIRLYEIVDIPIDEGLYIMRCSFEGFSIIFQKTGYFQVESDLICVNLQGKIKIWANKNLSKNYPQFSTINHNKTESDFIKKIIKTIEQSVDYDGRRKFSQYINNKKITIKFENIFGLLAEYGKSEHVSHCKAMNTILQLFREKNNNNSNSSNNLKYSNNSNNSHNPQNLNNFYKDKKYITQLSSEQQDTSFNKKQQKTSRGVNSMHQPLTFLKPQLKSPLRKSTIKDFTPKKKIQNSSIKEPNYQQELRKIDKIDTNINQYNHYQDTSISHYPKHYHPIRNNHNNNSNTPISFSYKNTTLYSPQNQNKSIQSMAQINNKSQILQSSTNQNQPKLDKIEEQIPNKIKKQLDSSKNYYAPTNMFEIDPEIAKDLEMLAQ